MAIDQRSSAGTIMVDTSSRSSAVRRGLLSLVPIAGAPTSPADGAQPEQKMLRASVTAPFLSRGLSGGGRACLRGGVAGGTR